MMSEVRPVFKVILLGLGILAASGAAQDIEASWKGYISAEQALANVQGRLKVIQEESTVLTEKITSLQERRSLFARWLVKMRLARMTGRQVQLSDSIQALRDRMGTLETRRQDAFERLTASYRGLLDDTHGGKDLTDSEKRIGLSIVKLMLTRQRGPMGFPHYDSLLEQEFDDERVRSMVLQDLQNVLAGKLEVIDSLLARRRSEQELVRRVNEFHLGLKMQSQTEFDPGSDLSARGTNVAAEDAANGFLTGRADDYSPERSSSEKSLLDISSYEKQLSTVDQRDTELGMDPIQSEIAGLESKRQEYTELIAKIRDELTH